MIKITILCSPCIFNAGGHFLTEEQICIKESLHHAESV